MSEITGAKLTRVYTLWGSTYVTEDMYLPYAILSSKDFNACVDRMDDIAGHPDFPEYESYFIAMQFEDEADAARIDPGEMFYDVDGPSYRIADDEFFPALEEAQ